MRKEKKRTEVFEFGIGIAECGKKKRGQSFEFGIGNAECGKKKRGQSFEFGIGVAECGKKKRWQMTELEGKLKLRLTISPLFRCLSKFVYVYIICNLWMILKALIYSRKHNLMPNN